MGISYSSITIDQRAVIVAPKILLQRFLQGRWGHSIIVKFVESPIGGRLQVCIVMTRVEVSAMDKNSMKLVDVPF